MCGPETVHVLVSTNGLFAEGYAYDALGRRVSTTDSSGTVYHAYDGIHCVADLSADGTLLRSYTWGAGVDNLLAVTLYDGDSTNTLYAVTDPLGTVHALVGTNGVPAVTYAYDSWGNLLSVNGDETLAAPLRFTWQGREYSYATGLYSFRARWYDPSAGRWLSKDPIGLEGGLNLYEAFGNNPAYFRDPEGKFLGAILGGIGGFFIGGISSAVGGKGFLRGAIPGLVGGVVAGLTFNPALGIASASSVAGAIGGTQIGATVFSSVVAGVVSGAASGLASGAVTETWDYLDDDCTTEARASDLWASVLAGAVAGGLLGPMGNQSDSMAEIYKIPMNINIATWPQAINEL